MTKIFLTGASGCVGHYLVDELSPDYELYLLVRDPGRLRFDPGGLPGVTVIQGDLDTISAQADLLSRMDYCVHAAAAWGGEAAERINFHRTLELFSLLDPGRIRRAVYFSTASILGRDNRVLPEAERYGTDYIRSKYRCYSALPGLAVADRLVTVFPTVIFGGDRAHPYSHVSRGLPALRRRARLLGYLNLEIAFHFIHARDIARIVRKLIEAPEAAPAYVLGNAPLTAGEFLKRAAAYFGHPVARQVRIGPRLLLLLARLARVRLSAWDRFCLEYGDFRYRTVDAATFGLPEDLLTVEDVLAERWRDP